MKKGKRRGLRKREALKIETYRQAFKIAVRHGRKYGVAGDRAEDIASDAYLVQARGKVKMTPWNFYRLRKKLKILLGPCFTEYREWLRRHRRVRGC